MKAYLCCCATLLSWSLCAQNILDPTFGNGGSVFTNLDTVTVLSCSPLVQSDGKIVLAGMGSQGHVVRYHSNGALDNAFGTNGKVSDTSFTLLSEVIQLSSGKILELDGQNIYKPFFQR